MSGLLALIGATWQIATVSRDGTVARARLVFASAQREAVYRQALASGSPVIVSEYWLRRWMPLMDPQRLKLYLMLRSIVAQVPDATVTLAELRAASGLGAQVIQRRLLQWLARPSDEPEHRFWDAALHLEGRPGQPYLWALVTDDVLHPDDLPVIEGQTFHLPGGAPLTTPESPLTHAGVNTTIAMTPITADRRYHDLGDNSAVIAMTPITADRSHRNSGPDTYPPSPEPPPPHAKRTSPGQGQGQEGVPNDGACEAGPDQVLAWALAELRRLGFTPEGAGWLLGHHEDAARWVIEWTALRPETNSSWLLARQARQPRAFLRQVVKRACAGDATCQRPPAEYLALAGPSERALEAERRAERRLVAPVLSAPRKVPALPDDVRTAWQDFRCRALEAGVSEQDLGGVTPLRVEGEALVARCAGVFRSRWERYDVEGIRWEH